MQSNPLPVLALWAIAAGVSTAAGFGAKYVYDQGVASARGEIGEQELLRRQAELAEIQARGTQIRTQVLIDQITPVFMLSIPVMIGIGAYAILRKKKADR